MECARSRAYEGGPREVSDRVDESAGESNRGGDVYAPSGDEPACVERDQLLYLNRYGRALALYSPLYVEAECDQDSSSDGESDADQTRGSLRARCIG